MLGRKKNLLFCHLRITDALDKQSHTCRRIHPLRNRNLWSKKAVQSDKVEHTFNICYWGTRKAFLFRQRYPETLSYLLWKATSVFQWPSFYILHLIFRALNGENVEKTKADIRRRPWKCQAQGIWPASIHPPIPQQIWFSLKPSREALGASVGWAGMNSSAVNLRGKRVGAICWPSTLLQPPEHQDLLTKRWMKLSLSGLYENVFECVLRV